MSTTKALKAESSPKTETVYATLDSEGDRIERDAAIFAFPSLQQAREYLLDGFPENWWRWETAAIEAGSYGDAWIKTLDYPAPYVVEPFTLDECSIARPGEHPGGREYWITPRPDVLVVSHIEPKE